MKAGFIGLGHLGRAMATRLINVGVELTVWNRTPEKTRGLKAQVAGSPSELADEAEFIILNLFDSNAVMAVMGGPEGLFESDLAGKTIIDTTTNHFAPVAGFHSAFKNKGAEYLEAPVLGSVTPALAGALTVLVSGHKPAFKAALPYLEKIGKEIFYLERPGLATKMKLVNNLLLGTFMTSIAEAIVIGEAAGIKRETVLDVLSKGAGDSVVLRAKREKLLREDFHAHFKTALIYKDLHFLQDLTKELNLPLFTGATAKELFALAASKGAADEDFSAIYRILKGPGRGFQENL